MGDLVLLLPRKCDTRHLRPISQSCVIYDNHYVTPRFVTTNGPTASASRVDE
ncbi:hypothetical protein BN10_740009 [Phycicoccus elongatus Lp2]|uniref:Uncharacterized protein n=1 Tax=Phycicoccus elongatus Lp2 TaxID=1193181 RepID=N0E284_9MICO|nr:hypothetical protein BN10_740009 [Phycicoccus elongatus Lp2]